MGQCRSPLRQCLPRQARGLGTLPPSHLAHFVRMKGQGLVDKVKGHGPGECVVECEIGIQPWECGGVAWCERSAKSVTRTRHRRANHDSSTLPNSCDNSS